MLENALHEMFWSFYELNFSFYKKRDIYFLSNFRAHRCAPYNKHDELKENDAA